MPPLTFPMADGNFSREAALYFANACDLAYQDDPGEAAREFLGLDAVAFAHAESSTQGFAGRGDGFAVLAFRGSERPRENPRDWLTNFEKIQSQEDPFTGQVHTGFSRAVNASWDTIDPVLRRALAAGAAVGADDPGVPLYLTGHSLGGALATLASFRLSSGQLPAAGTNPAVRFVPRATYTFGAPRVGNTAFCAALVKPPLYRVVNNLDIVPLVPLRGSETTDFRARLPRFTPQWARRLVEQADSGHDYDDAETLVYIDAAGNLTQGGARPDWLTAYTRQSLQSFGRSLDAPVADHFIDSYLRALHG